MCDFDFADVDAQKDEKSQAFLSGAIHANPALQKEASTVEFQ